jgi:hypothetical protein
VAPAAVLPLPLLLRMEPQGRRLQGLGGELLWGPREHRWGRRWYALARGKHWAAATMLGAMRLMVRMIPATILGAEGRPHPFVCGTA